MHRHDRLTEPGEIVDDLALAGITIALADYGRLAVTCHCGGVPWRLRRDASTRRPDFSEISRVFTRDGADRSPRRAAVFSEHPPGVGPLAVRATQGRVSPHTSLRAKGAMGQR